jgi:hypothetical protein
MRFIVCLQSPYKIYKGAGYVVGRIKKNQMSGAGNDYQAGFRDIVMQALGIF